MFGTNSIRGTADFKGIEDRLLVTSIFLTLQGEGPYQGQPALFIRTTGCQLSCVFCDTFFDEGSWLTLHDLLKISMQKILDKYDSLARCGIVITGGEPSLQPAVAAFLLYCEAMGVAFTQIESNGILPIRNLPTKTKAVISPKCSEKTQKYLQPHFYALSIAACLKFVVTVDKSSPYHTIPDWAFKWKDENKKPIYISPMNMYRLEVLQAAIERVKERKEHNIDYRSTVDEVVSGWDDKVLDRAKNEANHRYAAQYAFDHGLWLTLQMQLYAVLA